MLNSDDEMNFYQKENDRIRKKAELAFMEAKESIQNAGLDADTSISSKKCDDPENERREELELISSDKHLIEKIEKRLVDDEDFIQYALKQEHAGTAITNEAMLRFYQAKCMTYEEEYKVLKKEHKLTTKNKLELEEKLKALSLESEKIKIQNASISDKLSASESLCESLKDENTGLRKKNKEILRDFNLLQQKSKTGQQFIDSKESRLQRALEEVQRVKKQLESTNESIKSQKNVHNEKINNLQSENTRLRKLTAEMENAIKKQTHQISVIKKQQIHSETSKELLKFLKSSQLK
eukprot:NODE_307_length_11332_cov_0.276774.p5 type:complete len:295 gc:universal NODE_307_length_11332_cov_0.276774:8009-8893(+)